MAWNSANFNADLDSALCHVPGLISQLSDSSPSTSPTQTQAEDLGNKVAASLRLAMARCGFDMSAFAVTSASDIDYALQDVEGLLVSGHVVRGLAFNGPISRENADQMIEEAWGDGAPGSDSFESSRLGRLCGLDSTELAELGVTAGNKPASTGTATWTATGTYSTDRTRDRHKAPGRFGATLDTDRRL